MEMKLAETVPAPSAVQFHNRQEKDAKMADLPSPRLSAIRRWSGSAASA